MPKVLSLGVLNDVDYMIGRSIVKHKTTIKVTLSRTPGDKTLGMYFRKEKHIRSNKTEIGNVKKANARKDDSKANPETWQDNIRED